MAFGLHTVSCVSPWCLLFSWKQATNTCADIGQQGREYRLVHLVRPTKLVYILSAAHSVISRRHGQISRKCFRKFNASQRIGRRRTNLRAVAAAATQQTELQGKRWYTFPRSLVLAGAAAATSAYVELATLGLPV